MRWLVMGAGAAGSIHIRQLMARDHDVEVKDADLAKADKLAKETGCRVDSGAEEYDGVVIATPACTHVALVERALGMAPIVVCEKPLALTSAEAEAIAAMAPDRIYVAESQCYDGEDALDTRRMAERVRRGDVGRPVIWRVNAMTGFRPQDWCMDIGVGGGAFLEGGVHILTTARVLFGEAIRWQGSVRSFQGGSAPDTGTFVIDYIEGDQVALSMDWGTEGCFTGECAPMGCAAGLVGPERCLPWWPPDNHAAMWDHLLKCFRQEDEPVASVHHAAGAVADVWRCYAAAGISPPPSGRDRPSEFGRDGNV